MEQSLFKTLNFGPKHAKTGEFQVGTTLARRIKKRHVFCFFVLPGFYVAAAGQFNHLTLTLASARVFFRIILHTTK